MSNQPNEPVQNYEIVNPTLEQQVRTLLPSVAGYGGLLRSTNTVIPVVDVTTAAEGSTLPEALQFCMAFGSQTSVTAQNNTQTGPSVPGFYRIFGVATLFAANNAPTVTINLTDGLTIKTLFNFLINSNSATVLTTSETWDFIVFLATGESLTIASNNTRAIGQLTYRQIATADGTLVDPSGYPV